MQNYYQEIIINYFIHNNLFPSLFQLHQVFLQAYHLLCFYFNSKDAFTLHPCFSGDEV